VRAARSCSPSPIRSRSPSAPLIFSTEKD
jgi:hypothetical protein